MKKKLLCIALCILAAYMQVYAQGMSVNTTGTPANASAMLDVASTTQGMLVPRMTTTQRTGISLPAKGLLVYDSTLASFYYNSGTPSSPSWTALGGSSLPSGTNGQVLQLVSGSPAWVGNTLTIGASYGGGKIAYILQLGDPGYSALEQHGLIAATSDQSTGIIWGCYGTLEGATGFLLNTGRNNTEIIYQNCGTSGNASAICKSYTGGGYTDWYLPSKDELNKLYINQGAIGGFASAFYWSSSEYDAHSAWYQYVSSGGQASAFKSNTGYVRAVRAF